MAEAGRGDPDQHLAGAGRVELEGLDRERLGVAYGPRRAHLAQNRGSDLHSVNPLQIGRQANSGSGTRFRSSSTSTRIFSE